MKSYQTDGPVTSEYLYPGAGDPEPYKGAKVQLLTEGGIHTSGPWDNSFCVAWLPLPKRNKQKEDLIEQKRKAAKDGNQV